jgi:ATP-dependent protease ClpP protease subunit
MLMASSASLYRPSFDRSVKIIGEFNDSLAASALPEILKFRLESNDPITVFIHSPGGQVNTLEAIERALQTTHYDVPAPRIITVAVGDVSSAAANLLVLGDYAIVYPVSELLFHGVRVGEVQVTSEGAQNMAARLAKLNRKISQRIALRIMPRIMFRFLQLRHGLKKKGPLTHDECVMLFEKAIAAKVGTAARRLLRRTYSKVENALTLSGKIVPKIKFSKTFSTKTHDAKVLKAVLKHELANAKDPDWSLDEAGIQQLVDDYLLLRSWHITQTEGPFFWAVARYGPDCFSQAQAESYKKIKQTNEGEALNFLHSIAAPWIAKMWYFAVTLSRNLLVNENLISSGDAYWLGLVDEVMGLKLKCERSVVEDSDNNKNKPSATPASTSTVTTTTTSSRESPLSG